MALNKDHGSTRLLLHRGPNETEAVEIAAAIRNVTGLAYDLRRQEIKELLGRKP